jgi:hypothetical protein
MKHILSILTAVVFSVAANAQITITATDMPVAGDLLSFSNALTAGVVISPGDSGVNVIWNYSLSSSSVGVDTYKTAAQVSPLYAITVSSSAFGYKIADSIPGLSMIPGGGGLSVTNLYTFFEEKTSPDRYVAAATGYTVNNTIPLASNYSSVDVWYSFPLAYGNPTDSNNYAVTMGLAGTATIKQHGYRKTRVDGWGTLTTPYFTTPVNCIRVRSEIHEIDSIKLNTFNFGIPRNSVEYKWLVNGEHYPALWVTSNLNGTNETITTIRYRDALPSKVQSVNTSVAQITAFPNPATGSTVTLGLPADWKAFQVEVFDVQGKQVASLNNTNEINVSSFAAGHYIVRITSGTNTGYTMITK